MAITRIEERPPSARPTPDGLTLSGTVCALIGYFLPWFRERGNYKWSYSGYNYIYYDGPGWTIIAVISLVAAVILALWSKHITGAMLTLGTSIAAFTFSTAVVAASFAAIGEQGRSQVVGLPFGIGLLIMAAGFGMAIAGSVRAIVRALVAESMNKSE
jgi:hypothetical protein